MLDQDEVSKRLSIQLRRTTDWLSYARHFVRCVRSEFSSLSNDQVHTAFAILNGLDLGGQRYCRDLAKLVDAAHELPDFRLCGTRPVLLEANKMQRDILEGGVQIGLLKIKLSRRALVV